MDNSPEHQSLTIFSGQVRSEIAGIKNGPVQYRHPGDNRGGFRVDSQFNVACPKALVEAVQDAAARNLQSANSYARGALLKALERDGVKLTENVAA